MIIVSIKGNSSVSLPKISSCHTLMWRA